MILYFTYFSDYLIVCKFLLKKKIKNNIYNFFQHYLIKPYCS